MTKECLTNVRNYANKENALNVENKMTATYTYDLCIVGNELKTFDMTRFIDAGDSISQITVKVSEGAISSTVIVAGSGPVAVSMVPFPLTDTIRIDYKVETVNGDVDDAPPVFFNPTIDSETRGSSDPNCPPLRLKTTEGGVLGCVLCFEQDFLIANTLWTVVHNTGVLRPASLELYNLSDARMFTGITVVDANQFTITFASPKSGRVKALFIKP